MFNEMSPYKINLKNFIEVFNGKSNMLFVKNTKKRFIKIKSIR